MKKIISALSLISVLAVGANAKSSLSDLEKDTQIENYNNIFRLAKSGDVDSQTILGEMYLDGLGVKADIDKAFYWISKAANNGDSKAQYLLGFMYENGIKVQMNLPRAVILYKKAATEGDIMAKYHLAIMYHQGIGVEKDNKKAISLLKEIRDTKSRLITASS